MSTAHTIFPLPVGYIEAGRVEIKNVVSNQTADIHVTNMELLIFRDPLPSLIQLSGWAEFELFFARNSPYPVSASFMLSKLEAFLAEPFMLVWRLLIEIDVASNH